MSKKCDCEVYEVCPLCCDPARYAEIVAEREKILAASSAPRAESPQAGLLNIAQRIDTIRGSLEIRRREMSGANHWPHSESVREIEMLLTELAADVRAAFPRSEGRAETEATGEQPSALQKVRAYLVRCAKDVTKPTKYGFQMLRRDRDDGSIEYQIFADTKGNGRQIAWVQSSRQDAEFITACLAQAPLFAELLASPSPAPTAHAETPTLEQADYAVIAEAVDEHLGFDITTREQQDRITRWCAALSRHAEPQLLKQEKSDEGCGNRGGERDDSGDSQHVEGRADGSDNHEERLRRSTGGSSERLSGPDCHQQAEAQVASRHAEPQEPSEFQSGWSDTAFATWWATFGETVKSLSVENIACAAFSAGKHRAEPQEPSK